MSRITTTSDPAAPAIPTKAATFSKVFRLEPADPKAPLPVSVAVVGTFSDWQPVPLKWDRANRVWQLLLENIPGNCTHHYMLLVNGRPTNDKNADGFAMPATEQEKAYALTTPRGPRLFMLFSQTK